MKVFVSDQAHLDLNEIENWYFERGEHLPDLFYNEFEELLALIQDHPETGICIEDGYRLFLMTQFPYLVLCEFEHDCISVIHVIHEKQHPNLRYKRIK